MTAAAVQVCSLPKRRRETQDTRMLNSQQQLTKSEIISTLVAQALMQRHVGGIVVAG